MSYLISDPLAKFLRLYCDVNATDMVQMLRFDLEQNRIQPEEGNLFRKQLASAILNRSMTPEQYKSLTGDNEYGTPEELEGCLRTLWQDLFDDTPEDWE